MPASSAAPWWTPPLVSTNSGAGAPDDDDDDSVPLLSEGDFDGEAVGTTGADDEAVGADGDGVPAAAREHDSQSRGRPTHARAAYNIII